MPLWEGVSVAVLLVDLIDSEVCCAFILMLMMSIGGGGSDSLDALDAPGG